VLYNIQQIKIKCKFYYSKILKKNKKLQSKNARYNNKLKPGMLIEIGVLNNNYYYKCDETIYFGFE
jgi:hypothetical protein